MYVGTLFVKLFDLSIFMSVTTGTSMQSMQILQISMGMVVVD